MIPVVPSPYDYPPVHTRTLLFSPPYFFHQVLQLYIRFASRVPPGPTFSAIIVLLAHGQPIAY